MIFILRWSTQHWADLRQLLTYLQDVLVSQKSQNYWTFNFFCYYCLCESKNEDINRIPFRNACVFSSVLAAFKNGGNVKKKKELLTLYLGSYCPLKRRFLLIFDLYLNSRKEHFLKFFLQSFPRESSFREVPPPFLLLNLSTTRLHWSAPFLAHWQFISAVRDKMPQKGREGNGWPILGTAKIAGMLEQWKDKQTWNKRR